MGTWGVGMQANDTALDEIGAAKDSGDPVKYLKDNIDKWLMDKGEYGNGRKSILGVAEYCLDKRKKLSSALISKVKVAVKQGRDAAESFTEVQERLDALQRFEDRLDGKMVSRKDLDRDNEGLLSKAAHVLFKKPC